MKSKLIFATLIACFGLMLQPSGLYAEEDASDDGATYEENMQGYEDSSGNYDDTTMNSETSGSETEGEPSDNYDDPEEPSDN